MLRSPPSGTPRRLKSFLVSCAFCGRAHNRSVAALPASSRTLPDGLMLAFQPPGERLRASIRYSLGGFRCQCSGFSVPDTAFWLLNSDFFIPETRHPKHVGPCLWPLLSSNPTATPIPTANRPGLCGPHPEGLCCLVWDQPSRPIHRRASSMVSKTPVSQGRPLRSARD